MSKIILLLILITIVMGCPIMNEVPPPEPKQPIEYPPYISSFISEICSPEEVFQLEKTLPGFNLNVYITDITSSFTTNKRYFLRNFLLKNFCSKPPKL